MSKSRKSSPRKRVLIPKDQRAAKTAAAPRAPKSAPKAALAKAAPAAVDTAALLAMASSKRSGPRPQSSRGGRKQRETKKNVRQTSLTPEQEAFAQHYSIHKNGAEAVRAAYPSAKEQSDQYLAQRGHILRTTDKIHRRIAELQDQAAETIREQYDITVSSIVREIAPIVFANPADYYEFGYTDKPAFDKRGQPIIDPETGLQEVRREPFAYAKPSSSLTRDQMKAVVGATMNISKSGDKTIEVKLGNKLAAAQMLLGLLTKQPDAAQPAQPPVHLNVLGAVQVVNGSGETVAEVSSDKDALSQFETMRAALYNSMPGAKKIGKGG